MNKIEEYKKTRREVKDMFIDIGKDGRGGQKEISEKMFNSGFVKKDPYRALNQALSGERKTPGSIKMLNTVKKFLIKHYKFNISTKQDPPTSFTKDALTLYEFLHKVILDINHAAESKSPTATAIGYIEDIIKTEKKKMEEREKKERPRQIGNTIK